LGVFFTKRLVTLRSFSEDSNIQFANTELFLNGLFRVILFANLQRNPVHVSHYRYFVEISINRLSTKPYLCRLPCRVLHAQPKAESNCQMVYFETKNPNLGKFRRVLQCKKMLVYFMEIWYILRPFGIFCGH
jgi:hypothetical protein